MKKFNIKISDNFRPIGRVEFTYDKPFYRNFSKYPTFIRAKNSSPIMSNETPEDCINFIKKIFKNPSDFKIILNKVEPD